LATLTEPILSLPIIINTSDADGDFYDAGPHFTVTLTAPAASFNVTLSDGTYWNTAESGAGSIGQEILDALNAADPYVATWAAVEPGSGLSHRWELTRDGPATHEVQDIDFLTDVLTPAMMGFDAAATAVVPTAEDIPNGDTTFTSTFQRGRIWLPREIAFEPEDYLIKPTSVAFSKFSGRSKVVRHSDGFTERIVRVELVKAALVHGWASDDSDFVSAVSGASVDDPNLAFDRFLDAHGESGLTPIRYAPDVASPATYTEMKVVSAEALTDAREAVEEVSTAPKLFTVSVTAVLV
jgi:hypothetical protein